MLDLGLKPGVKPKKTSLRPINTKNEVMLNFGVRPKSQSRNLISAVRS